MTTSLLLTAPDLAAVCASAVGRAPREVQPIGRGANSRVFRVSFDDGTAPLVVKCYRRDGRDPRDRLAAEFGGLEFLWQHGIRLIPRPIARDSARQCALYEWIPGAVPESRQATPHDIDAMVSFLGELRVLATREDARSLPPASEACFSLEAVVGSVRARMVRLREGTGDGARRPMLEWLERRLDPLVAEIEAWARRRAAAAGIGFDAEIDGPARTLSPSDFGFHNAIRRPDGVLAYVDFEYFGWDDPAKTVADFLLHPGMSLSPSIKRHFAGRFVEMCSGVPSLAERARLAYPLFGLKWCTILLNELLPERLTARTGLEDAGIGARQLSKAQRLADQLARDYAANPYFPAL